MRPRILETPGNAANLAERKAFSGAEMAMWDKHPLHANGSE